jgi:cytochrome c oxidase cbb3-type subunit I/II
MKMSLQPPQTEEIDYHAGDKAVKWWFIAAALWFPFFTLFGFILAIKFFEPGFLGNAAWDSFGRIRPSHVNGVLFGFVSSGLIAAMLYIIPRLCAAPLRKATLAKWAAVLWNLNIIGGIVWIMLGGSQGREYAELPWVNDCIVVALLLVFTYIVFNNLVRRQEKKMFVSLWYYGATFLIFPIVYFIGNVMWRPPVGALNGTVDAIFNWYYGHNVLGLWFTTMGVPAMYYFIARILKKPIYSHLLSLMTFFTLAFFYTGVGAHHLLQAPIPPWLKTTAVIMSILMAVPIIAFITNILLTMRGSWNKVFNNAPLGFFVFAMFAYVIASFQGSFQGLPTTNAFLHFSQWPVGHAHLALLGAFGVICVGAAYWVIPRITGFRIYSTRIMNFNFWLLAVGFLFFFIAMTGAGLQQNSNWYTHINVVETLPTLKIWFVVRAISGGVVVLSAFIFAINIFMTFWASNHPYIEKVVEEVPPYQTALPESKFQRRSQRGLSLGFIMTSGVSLFSIMTFMVVAMPYMYTSNEPSPRAQAPTDQEQRGLVLYKTLGCEYCHNQFIRVQDWAMGIVSDPGDFYYSIPNFLGTERTGPSLSQIGGKRPTEWHIQHDKDPRTVSPSSIMPPFGFLSDNQLTDLVSYIQTLGTEDLNTQSFQPLVPSQFADKTNPNAALMAKVLLGYDGTQEVYSGNPDDGQAFGDLFDQGKQLFTEKCLSCHGCSGDGQGTYARQLVTRPANIHERLINYPVNKDAFHFWRIHEGVPGTGMPAWGLSLSDSDIWEINTYESSFDHGAIRTISGDVSDGEGDDFDAANHPVPLISGSAFDFSKGQDLFNMYCAQCHGTIGHGDGPASIAVSTGYIDPRPANFEESGGDFKNYGRWLWKVKEGVETTNMPPWKYALTGTDIYQLIFYIQTFSTADDYNSKWAPLYTDPFALNFKR